MGREKCEEHPKKKKKTKLVMKKTLRERQRRDRLNCTNLDLILMISLHFSPPKETVELESSVSLKYLLIGSCR